MESIMAKKAEKMKKNGLVPINPAEYKHWLQNICNEIDRQKLQAIMQLNSATLQHYWWVGNDILRKQKEQGWGTKVIDMLSRDLQKRYGSDSGYSIRNLKYMRKFAKEYPDFPFVQVPLAQLQEKPILQAKLAKFTISSDGAFVQVPLAQITWYHHISLFPKVKDTALRAFYITETAHQGWNRDVMLLQIESEDNHIDILMYHTQLHCYVVIELKVVDFRPEFASKLNYYISAVDDLLKTPQDNPTIGLLLCRSKSNTKVEYALRGMTQPLGVAEFQTKKVLEDIKSSLQSIDDLEKNIVCGAQTRLITT